MLVSDRSLVVIREVLEGRRTCDFVLGLQSS